MNKTTLSVRELQKTLGQWKKRNVTDTIESKLLELYLGVTAYMNGEQMYPLENFYDIGRGLRFRTTKCLTDAVRQCGSFGIVPGENIYGMNAFYSVLWYDRLPEEEPTADSSDILQCKCQMDDIYNILTPKGDDAEKTASAGETVAVVKAFFHRVNEDLEDKAQIFTPLIDWFQLHEKLTRSEARNNLVYLVNELLVPYFARQKRFMQSTHAGRLRWLQNLLKSAHGQHLLNNAARAERLQREQDGRELHANQRRNQPISPFEWTDAETGMRFYDDELEGAVHIPDEAQPRPSAQAVWNVLSASWNFVIHNS